MKNQISTKFVLKNDEEKAFIDIISIEGNLDG
jgi:hypothetical protein